MELAVRLRCSTWADYRRALHDQSESGRAVRRHRRSAADRHRDSGRADGTRRRHLTLRAEVVHLLSAAEAAEAGRSPGMGLKFRRDRRTDPDRAGGDGRGGATIRDAQRRACPRGGDRRAPGADQDGAPPAHLRAAAQSGRPGAAAGRTRPAAGPGAHARAAADARAGPGAARYRASAADHAEAGQDRRLRRRSVPPPIPDEAHRGRVSRSWRIRSSWHCSTSWPAASSFRRRAAGRGLDCERPRWTCRPGAAPARYAPAIFSRYGTATRAVVKGITDCIRFAFEQLAARDAGTSRAGDAGASTGRASTRPERARQGRHRAPVEEALRPPRHGQARRRHRGFEAVLRSIARTTSRARSSRRPAVTRSAARGALLSRFLKR